MTTVTLRCASLDLSRLSLWHTVLRFDDVWKRGNTRNAGQYRKTHTFHSSKHRAEVLHSQSTTSECYTLDRQIFCVKSTVLCDIQASNWITRLSWVTATRGTWMNTATSLTWFRMWPPNWANALKAIELQNVYHCNVPCKANICLNLLLLSVWVPKRRETLLDVHLKILRICEFWFSCVHGSALESTRVFIKAMSTQTVGMLKM